MLRSRLLAAALAATLIIPAAHGQGLTSIQATPLDPQASQLSAANPSLVVLRSGAFDPRHAELRYPPAFDVVATNVVIVQFDPTAMRGARDRLLASKLRILDYLPNNAFLVEADSQQAAAAGQIDGVRAVSPFKAGMKVANALLFGDVPQRSPVSQLIELELTGFAGLSAQTMVNGLRKLNPALTVLVAREDATLPRVRVGVTPAAYTNFLADSARLSSVRWIEAYLQPYPANQNAVAPIQGNAATGTPVWDRDIIGTGQIIAVMDSGLDRNEDWFTSIDTGSGPNSIIVDAQDPIPPQAGTLNPAAKVIGYWVQPGSTAYDNNVACPGGSPTSFHGTHVSGTVAGDRGTIATPTSPNNGLGEGMAPNAQILFQDIGNDVTGCLSITDFGGSLAQALAGGAHVHNNSWGAPTGGAYTGNDIDGDAASWILQDLMVVTSAGNSGPSGNTTGSPGNSKNLLTVGALGNGNSTSIAGFSSRGPTDDGRIKPDIVAPGSSTVSAAGNSNNSGTVQAGTTKPLSGTSMASPTVVGGAALMRQYFEDGFYPRGERTAGDELSISGVLNKAFLLNGTRVLGTWPSNTFGWGRIHLDGSLYFDGDTRRARYFERPNSAGLATGEEHVYSVEVAAGEEFRATLTWFDVEGAAGAGVALVNDLDLVVEGPGGTYRGNVFSAGLSTTGGSADALNTVEQVRLNGGGQPATGTYTLRVQGGNVPGNSREGSDRQGYALVVSGAIGLPDQPAAAAPVNLQVASNDASGIAIGFDLVGGADGYVLYRVDGSCAGADLTQLRQVQHGGTSPLLDQGTQGGFEYAYVVRAIDNDVEGTASTCIDVVSAAPCTLQPSFDGASFSADAANSSCSVVLSWAQAQASCPNASGVTYDILSDDNPFFTSPTVIATDLTGETFTDTAVTNGVAVFYQIIVNDDFGNFSADQPIIGATPTGADGFDPNATVDNVEGATYMVTSSPWTISNARAFSPTLSYRNASGDTTTTYTNNTCGFLTSPAFTVPVSGQVQFRARFNIELSWDGVVVQTSTDGGDNWTSITPVEGYPGSLSQTGNPPVNACGFPASQGAFTGSSDGNFNTYTLDLAAFEGQQLMIRWAFTSDPAAEEEGFYLDDISWSGAGNPFPDRIMFADFEDGEMPPVGTNYICAP